MKRYDLSGRTVVITGSTGGLGEQVARIARERGANLALLDIDGSAAAKQAASLGSTRVARGWEVDVRDYQSVADAMAQVDEHFGRTDVVIAGAGITSMAPMSRLDPAVAERVIDINLLGVWRTFRAAIPYVQRQRGYLMAISSMAAFVHSPLQTPYTASKAGVWALCDSLRLELRDSGVGVGSVHPTFFATAMMEDTVADPAGNVLWGGNKSGFWKMVDIDQVTSGIISGIEKRRDTVVVPKSQRVAAIVPALVRPIIERVGFRGDTIKRASEVASSAGWVNPRSSE
ncbi:SDR family NAD(P)-dependent oxidoreductase [Rhodococcus pyridinivorans]|uniref:SDR family NAD(P)-dependent oxidoreductase n=1 Tax=Rhodococcus pyridinivorans TaxID=103816 RepID=UPI0039B4DF1A